MTKLHKNNGIMSFRLPRLLVGASAIATAIAATPAMAGGDNATASSGSSAQNTPVSQSTQEENFRIRFRADTLVLTPVMNVDLVGAARSAVAGEKAEFQTYVNYPAFVIRGEIRIMRASDSLDAEPLAIVPVDDDGYASWDVPTDAPEALAYVFRVYDAEDRFDETGAEELTVVDPQLSDAGDTRNQDLSRPSFGAINETSRRNIQLNGLMATVTGQARADDEIRVSGQRVPAGEDGRFVAQQIVPRAKAGMDVVITRDGSEIKRVSQDFDVPKDDWFIVGQGDLTIGTSFSDGPAAAVSGDSQAEGDYVLGRAAFYAKGVVNEDVRVTASLDTGETLLEDIFSNLDRKDPRQLFRRLDSDQHYPTYGDDSTLVEDAPTQGRFYLRVEKDDNRFIIGNFSTAITGAELAQLDRGLFGALIDLNATATTSFGERKHQVTAFASDPGTVPGRDEFRGTGGSLYFLSRRDVSVGSERIRVEIRDRETGLVLETRNLFPQQDYDFDPFQGRLTLLRPLSSVAATGETVRNGSSSGNIPVLVVRYEYSPDIGDLDGYTIGGRATKWIGEKVRLGATAQRDTVEEADQTLFGADILLRQTAGSYLKAEIAQTDGPAFGQANSVDGGLNFTNFPAAGPVGGKAYAWRFEAAANFGELRGKSSDLGQLGGYFEHFDAGFNSVGQLTAGDTERWGVDLDLPIGTNTRIKAEYAQIESDVGANRTGIFDLAQQLGSDISGTLGLRYEDRSPGTLFNSIQLGERIDAAAQLTYTAPVGNYELFGFGQATLDRDATRQRNNRFGVGGKVQLSERISLDAETSEGDGGLAADVQLNHRLGDGSEAYLGYSLFAERTDTALQPQNLFTRSNRGTLTLGARHRLSDALSVYGENRIGHGGTAPSLVRSYGFTFDPAEHLSFQGSFENGRIDDAITGVFRRTAATFSVGYTKPGLRLGTGLEARSENGNNLDQTVWLVRNNADIAVNPDWRLIGRLNFAIADEDRADVRAADFVEGVLGLAFRPVDNERLNALLRFTYFQDLGPVGQVSGSGTIQNPKQISEVISLDVNYDLTKSLTLGTRYAYRGGRVSLGRDSDTFVSSDAHLAVVRADYRVLRNWDVLVEGRYLAVPTADDNRVGALAAIYRHINENVKIGIGYSFSDFSDDLTDQSFTSDGPFLNLIGKL